MVLEKFEPTEVLPVGILQELLHHRLIALPIRVLEIVQTNQKADRQSRPTHPLDVEDSELFLEEAPVDLAGKNKKRVPSIEDVVKTRAEHVELVASAGRWTRCHFSPGNEGILLNSR
jgi:hypothetical protein